MGSMQPKDVTIIIRRKIKPGCEKQYDDWLRRFLMLEKNIPGYVGTTIITQGGTDSAIRHIVLRFSDTASLDAWEKSDEYLKQRAVYGYLKCKASNCQNCCQNIALT
jgi:antibiotic biosynthesis monooxygenase (ABM) superfamily enzyme